MSSIDTTIQPLPDSLTVAPAIARVERLAWSALVVGSCILAALVATWPLATTLLTAVPLGTEHESTVPLLNIWTFWWNADQAAHGFAHYWDAPFFFPFNGVFTYSEPQPLIGLVSPLWAVSAPPAIIYNWRCWRCFPERHSEYGLPSVHGPGYPRSSPGCYCKSTFLANSGRVTSP